MMEAKTSQTEKKPAGGKTAVGTSGKPNADKSAGTGANTGGGGLGNLADLVKAIQETKTLDPEKLTALKTELTALSKSDKMPMTVKLKMTPLLAALDSVKGTSPQDLAKLWETVKPFIGDAASLSKLTSLLGEYGGTVLDILKKVFLRT